MTSDEMMAQIETALVLALVEFGTGMTQDERRAFRLGFLAGTRHGLDAAREQMKEIAKQH
jgi:hypothetical protein